MARLIRRRALQLLAAAALCLAWPGESAARDGRIEFEYSDRDERSFYFNWHDYRDTPEGYARFDASLRTRGNIHSEVGYGFHHQNYRLRPGTDGGVPREKPESRFTWGSMLYVTDIDNDRVALSIAFAASLHFRLGLESPFFIGGGIEYTPDFLILNGRQRMAWNASILLEALNPVHFYLRYQYVRVDSRKFLSNILANHLAFGLNIQF